MPAALLRLFSTQDTPSQSTNNDEREQELKKTLGILGKPALSVTELEKQLLQPPTLEIAKSMFNNSNTTIEHLAKPILIENNQVCSLIISLKLYGTSVEMINFLSFFYYLSDFRLFILFSDPEISLEISVCFEIFLFIRIVQV